MTYKNKPEIWPKRFIDEYETMPKIYREHLAKCMLKRPQIPPDMAWVLFEDTLDIRFLLQMENCDEPRYTRPDVERAKGTGAVFMYLVWESGSFHFERPVYSYDRGL